MIEANQKALDRLLTALKPALPNASGASEDVLENLDEQLEATQKGFIESMDDDFNSAGALGNLFDLVRAINQARAENATDEQLAPAQNAFKELTGVLGLQMKTPEAAASSADAFIDLLVSLRQDLRESKNYELADKVRQDLASLGVVIEDTAQGSSWRWE